MQNFDTILLLIAGAIIGWTLGRTDAYFSSKRRDQQHTPEE